MSIFAVQTINSAVFVMGNAWIVRHRCGWFDNPVYWSNLLQFSCWNTVGSSDPRELILCSCISKRSNDWLALWIGKATMPKAGQLGALQMLRHAGFSNHGCQQCL